MGIVWYVMGRKRRCADTLTVVRVYQPFCYWLRQEPTRILSEISPLHLQVAVRGIMNLN
jgi:hypothetical protein